MPYTDKLNGHIFMHDNAYTARQAEAKEIRRPRWWFGGLSSTSVACVVAPMDLVKSHMQTQLTKKTMWQTVSKVVKLRGFIGFYDGFSSAALRQMICTSLRFSIYESGKAFDVVNDNFMSKIAVASFAGSVGAVVGIPLDLINVRMQNDMNYKHVFDALVRIPKEEGWPALYRGTTACMMKSAVGTIGQIAVYDHIKQQLVLHFNLDDDYYLHFQSSLMSSIISSIIAQPFDVLKTLLMNARPGEFKNIPDAVRYMLRFGPTGLFRGLMPTMARKGPATIMLFMIYEQLRLNLGYLADER